VARIALVPNTRVQRTRSSPSALRSPLTRHPLGGPKVSLAAALVTWFATLVACSSAVVENPSPAGAALARLCRDDGFKADAGPPPWQVPSQTSVAGWLAALKLGGFKNSDEVLADTALQARLESSFQPQPIVVSREAAACGFRSSAHPEGIVVELSGTVENPYVPGQVGVFARVSLNREQGATWFWVPLSGGPGNWTADPPVHLNVSDG
jgi:hypothetical protein